MALNQIVFRRNEHLLITFLQPIFVFVHKSCGELSQLVQLQCTTGTFGKAQSFDYKKWKVYQSKLNATQNIHKAELLQVGIFFPHPFICMRNFIT